MYPKTSAVVAYLTYTLFGNVIILIIKAFQKIIKHKKRHTKVKNMLRASRNTNTKTVRSPKRDKIVRIECI